MFRTFLVSCIAAVFCAVPSASFAADFPTKTIHLVSHSKPGGGMDIILRHLAVPLEKELGVPCVVEDRPGGGSAVAMTYVAKAKNPGHTLLGVTNTHFSTSLVNKPPFSIKDMRSVCKLVTDPLVMFVPAGSDYRSVQDVLDAAKNKPNTLSIAASQVGSVEYLIAYDLIKEGYKMKLIPFEAGGELVTSVMGGHVNIGICEPSEVMGQVAAGNIRVLCTFTSERLASIPNVPTATEVGLKSSMQKVRMVMVPKKTPDDIVKRLEAACKKAMADPEFIKFYQSNDMVADYKDAKAADLEVENILSSMAESLTALGLIK